MCPGTSRSSVTSGRNMPAPRAMPSRRPRRRRCRPRAAVPRRARSRTSAGVESTCDHLPLYRPERDLRPRGRKSNSTAQRWSFDWVGQAAYGCSILLWRGSGGTSSPREKIHGDDTTVPVLAPGLGRTKHRTVVGLCPRRPDRSVAKHLRPPPTSTVPTAAAGTRRLTLGRIHRSAPGRWVCRIRAL